MAWRGATNLLLLAVLTRAAHGASVPPAVGVSWSATTGAYNVTVDGAAWLVSTPPSVCVRGASTPLKLVSSAPISGSDQGFGAYTGVAFTFATADAAAAPVVLSSRSYAGSGTPFALGVAVLNAAFPAGLDTSGCPGGNAAPSTHFPSFSTTAGLAPSLGYLSWRSMASGTTVVARGLGPLNQAGLDAGPVVATDAASGASLVWSTLDSHKIVVQATDARTGTYSMGLSSAVPSIPAGWSYSVLLSAAPGGATAATYAWGAAAQAFSGTTRSPSVTLSNVGYYTDDGAYYYVWEAFGCCDPVTHAPRPWPAEEGLVLVKEDLWARGVPVAYMQMDGEWPGSRTRRQPRGVTRERRHTRARWRPARRAPLVPRARDANSPDLTPLHLSARRPPPAATNRLVVQRALLLWQRQGRRGLARVQLVAPLPRRRRPARELPTGARPAAAALHALLVVRQVRPAAAQVQHDRVDRLQGHKARDARRLVPLLLGPV